MNRDLPRRPAVRRMNRIVRGIVAAVAAVTMIGATWSPALADELDDRKLELQQELAQQAAAFPNFRLLTSTQVHQLLYDRGQVCGAASGSWPEPRCQKDSSTHDPPAGAAGAVQVIRPSTTWSRRSTYESGSTCGSTRVLVDGV